MEEVKTRIPGLMVHVTKELIEESEKRNSSHCMIAEAVNIAAEARGIKPMHVGVDIQTIRFSSKGSGSRYIHLTPRTCQEALINFDRGEHTEPFSFRLSSKTAQVVKIGRRTGRRRTAEERKEAKTKAPPRARARISKTSGHSGKRTGGKAPPYGPSAGGTAGTTPVGALSKRREFGLYGLRQ